MGSRHMNIGIFLETNKDKILPVGLELIGKTIEIPNCYVEIENEEGEIDEIFYTNVIFDEDEFEADDNKLSFFKNDAGVLCLKWKGKIQDFTEESDDYFPFELECEFSDKFAGERD